MSEPERDGGGVDAVVRSAMAAVWRRVCGVTFLVAEVAHRSAAVGR
ncbi:hypothetical protein ACFVDQ_42835 [Streptomyces sp. NPDC057684]